MLLVTVVPAPPEGPLLASRERDAVPASGLPTSLVGLVVPCLLLRVAARLRVRINDGKNEFLGDAGDASGGWLGVADGEG